jgi:Tol biopolymer transport system component
MSPDGRSLVTALGLLESGIYMHTPQGEHLLSTDGYASRLTFSRDGRFLFYLLRRASTGAAGELWQTELSSEKAELLLKSSSISSYSVSLDGTQILFSARPEHGPVEIWLASRNGTFPPRRLTASGEDQPMFGPAGEVVFRQSVNKNNYLFVMNADGSNRRQVAPAPIIEIRAMSPDRRLVVVMAPVNGNPRTAVLAVPLDGGPVRRICPATCGVRWSPDGARMYVTLLAQARPRATIAIPVPTGESMADLPPAGLRSEQDVSTIPGSQLVNLTPFNTSATPNEVAPGLAVGTFAFVRTVSHRNLFRVQLP